MLSSINASSGMQRPVQMHPQSQPMTDEQKTTASEILANYDASSMTETDHEALKAEFEEAGITPSQDLGKLMEESGFDVPKGPGGPQGVKGEGKPKPPEFSKLMKKLENSDVSEEEVQSFIQNLQNGKGKFSGSIMDAYA